MRCADIQPYKSRLPAHSRQSYWKQQLTSTSLDRPQIAQTKKMKTALIAGVCLLALTITTTDAVSKKQNCIPNLDLLACIDGYNTNSKTVCTDDCRAALTEYYDDCVSAGADAFRKGYALLCEIGGSSAMKVGATMFTTVSAVLVAVGN